MINKFRTMIQAELNKIENLNSGKIISDDMIEEKIYHFGYEIMSSVTSKSIDYSNDNMILNITGYLSTKGGSLIDFDKYADDICYALSKLNIRVTTKDVTTYDQTRKTMITGTVVLNTLDKTLR